MSNDFRIVVLISGRGSNLKSLIEGAQHYSIARVVSNKSEALGLETAAGAAVPTRVVPRESFPSIEEQKKAILGAVKAEAPDLVVLAGFMQILSPEFIAAFPRKVINIHPSLLPRHPGLDTHARAIADEATEHGCTVHLVDRGVDTGEIIAQARVPIFATDTPETLGARVLVREHTLLPWVVDSAARGEINLDRSPVLFSDTARQEAHDRGFAVHS